MDVIGNIWLLLAILELGVFVLIGAVTGLICGWMTSNLSILRGLGLGSLAGLLPAIVSVVNDFYGSMDTGLALATVLLVVLICRWSDHP